MSLSVSTNFLAHDPDTQAPLGPAHPDTSSFARISEIARVPEACLALFERLRVPKGLICPWCGVCKPSSRFVRHPREPTSRCRRAFNTLLKSPDYHVGVLAHQVTVSVRGWKVGSLNRRLMEWYVSELFVAAWGIRVRWSDGDFRSMSRPKVAGQIAPRSS